MTSREGSTFLPFPCDIIAWLSESSLRYDLRSISNLTFVRGPYKWEAMEEVSYFLTPIRDIKPARPICSSACFPNSFAYCDTCLEEPAGSCYKRRSSTVWGGGKCRVFEPMESFP